MALDFPSSPGPGQQYVVGGVTWTWDGTKWTMGASAASVSPVPMNDNRIINGDMRIDQRNNGASGTASGYTADRWTCSVTQTGKGAWQRTTGGAAALAQGIGYSLNFSSSTAYASLASDNFNFNQRIEADVITDFAWGTANAQPVTLSFMVFSSLTGTFGGSLCNGNPATRSYPFTFNVPSVNTWTKIAITIPGDTAGTWTLQGNGIGAMLNFDLGVGSSLRGPPGAWASADYRGANGAVSVVATNGASFNLTGVKLEIGSVATPFNRQSLAKSLIDCERYYQQGLLYSVFGASIPAGNTVAASSMPKVNMRAPPTMTIVGSSNSNFTVGTLGVSTGSSGATQGFWVNGSATATAAVGINVQFVANAEL